VKGLAVKKKVCTQITLEQLITVIFACQLAPFWTCVFAFLLFLAATIPA